MLGAKPERPCGSSRKSRATARGCIQALSQLGDSALAMLRLRKVIGGIGGIGVDATHRLRASGAKNQTLDVVGKHGTVLLFLIGTSIW